MTASLQITILQEVEVVTDKAGFQFVPRGSNLSKLVEPRLFFWGGVAYIYISEYNVGDRTPLHNVPEGLELILSA